MTIKRKDDIGQGALALYFTAARILAYWAICRVAGLRLAYVCVRITGIGYVPYLQGDNAGTSILHHYHQPNYFNHNTTVM
jgi:hypothetical protein